MENNYVLNFFSIDGELLKKEEFSIYNELIEYSRKIIKLFEKEETPVHVLTIGDQTCKKEYDFDFQELLWVKGNQDATSNFKAVGIKQLYEINAGDKKIPVYESEFVNIENPNIKIYVSISFEPGKVPDVYAYSAFETSFPNDYVFRNFTLQQKESLRRKAIDLFDSKEVVFRPLEIKRGHSSYILTSDEMLAAHRIVLANKGHTILKEYICNPSIPHKLVYEKRQKYLDFADALTTDFESCVEFAQKYHQDSNRSKDEKVEDALDLMEGWNIK